MKLVKNIKQYVGLYNESDLKKVIVLFGKKLGAQVVLYALIMFTLIKDSEVPLKVKMVFMAALGYLILPTDLIADILPVIGFTDDIAFLTYVVTSASEYITPEVKENAKAMMGKWIDFEAEEAEILGEDEEMST